MLWHHMIVDGKLDRPIYEAFGDKAYPIMTKIAKKFPDYAFNIAQSTLIGESSANPARGKHEPIISLYIPGSPKWTDYSCDHHAIKFHMESNKVEWKLLWREDQTSFPDNLPYEPVWVGMDYDEDFLFKGELHTYYRKLDFVPTKLSPISTKYIPQDDDLFGFTYDLGKEDRLTLKHIKLYTHPRWEYRDEEYLETNWDHINKYLDKDLPIDVTPVTDLEKTRGTQRFY